LRNSSIGTIGSTTRDSIQTKFAVHRIAPVAALLVGQSNEDRDQRSDEHARAEVIDARSRAARADGGQRAPDHREHDGADRQVDEEDPLPSDGVGDDPTDRRTDERAQPEHRADEALVLAALGGVEHVTDDRERDGKERTRAETLQRAECDELPHLPREARKQ
jgi:hypothetical protein